MQEDFDFEYGLLLNIYYKPVLVKELIIPSKCFKDKLNKFIFEAFIESYNNSSDISLPVILEEQKTKFTKELNEVVFMDRITHILELKDYDIRNFEYYQQKIFERYKNDLLKQVAEDFKNNKSTMDQYITNIHKIENLVLESDQTYLTNDMFEEATKKRKIINLRFERISAKLNLQEHDFMVVAARPGIGKTGFLLNLLEDISKSYNTILFNMEMSQDQVIQRLLSITSHVPMSDLESPQTEYQRQQIEHAKEDLINRKSITIYSRGQTIESIRKTIIQSSKQRHTVAFIDYIGLVGSLNKYNSLYEKTTAIVKELRQISLDYDCTIILAAQINRNGENKPTMADLKETGELEQSSTEVLILDGKDLSYDDIEIELTIAKNRNGKRGITTLKYHKTRQFFEEKGF